MFPKLGAASIEIHVSRCIGRKWIGKKQTSKSFEPILHREMKTTAIAIVHSKVSQNPRQSGKTDERCDIVCQVNVIVEPVTATKHGQAKTFAANTSTKDNMKCKKKMGTQRVQLEN